MLGNKLDKMAIYKLDKSDLYKAVTSLSDQALVAWNEVKLVDPLEGGDQINKIVVAGMGGSALGARVIKALWALDLRVPFEVVTDYHLPEYVDSRTWVILSSYSGTTEETINAGLEAQQKGAKVGVVCTGSDLAEMAKSEGWPAYIINPTYNPGNMPRMGIGYNLMALIGWLAKEGLANVTDKQAEEVGLWLKLQQTSLYREKKTAENPAKRLTDKLLGKEIVLIGARHLYGALHVFKNQLNENAKNFATLFEVPELNHHLMEGLAFPKELKSSTQVVVFESDLYEEVIQKRMKLTVEVLEKQGYRVTRIKPEGKSELLQVWETIQFGEFVAYYLAIGNNLDPAPIVWVDYFKKRMKEI